MKKYYILIILAVIIGTSVQAQQLPQYSQYVFNTYAHNPAVGGSQDYFDVKSNNRYMWTGITDAPRTYTLTVQGPLRNRKMGLGGFLFTDHVGPTRRTGFQVSYAYHLQVNDKMRLSLGVSGGLLQFAIDGSKITLRDEGDQVISNGFQSTLVPDAKAGLYFYQPGKFYFGVAAPQILQNKLYFFDYQNSTLSQLERHYYAMGGYTFDISSDFQIEPSFLVKYVAPINPQVDVTARFIYKDQVWIGATFRTEDALSGMIGFTYRQSLMFGYAYDFLTSNLANYSTGSHELMIGVKFIKPENTSAKMGG